MRIQVRFFSWLQDATGTSSCWLDLEAGARGVDAKTVLVDRYRTLNGSLEYVRLALNQEYQPWEVVLRPGDELALIPPVSGG